jgi:SAM-dependent methyltransferase
MIAWTTAPISAALRRFTAALPQERGPILDFALRVAGELEPDCRLLDVGAGESPYRELFGHVRYENTDWEHSVHPGARAVDHVGPAHELPVPDATYDAVLCTQVLEHVPNPAAVVAELARVLRPGGRLYVTVPLAWELHELPFDFFRYTPHALSRLLADAGFVDHDIRPRNDCFSTLAQLMDDIASTMGTYPDGRDGARAEAAAAMRAMAAQVAGFAELDARRVLPLGYSVAATRPAGAAGRGPGDRAAAGIADARGFLTLCFASDVVNDPSLLRAYGERFSSGDDATLDIYTPRCDGQEAAAALGAAVARAGLDRDDSPDLLALPYPAAAPDEAALAGAIDAVLALTPPWGAFSGAPWFHPGTLDALRERAAG